MEQCGVQHVPEDRGAARDEALLDLVGEVYALLDLEAFQPGLSWGSR